MKSRPKYQSQKQLYWGLAASQFVIERCAPSNFINYNGLAKDEKEKSKLSWCRSEVPHLRRVYMIFKNIKM